MENMTTVQFRDVNNLREELMKEIRSVRKDLRKDMKDDIKYVKEDIVRTRRSLTTMIAVAIPVVTLIVSILILHHAF